MKNEICELVFVLDRSGSMYGLESDTAGGFNRVLEEQKNGKGKVFVTTVLFNHQTEVLHAHVPIDAMHEMRAEDVASGGSTALLDALGSSIEMTISRQRRCQPHQRADRVLFVIMTDGLENASTRWTYAQLQRLIEQEKEGHGWEFLFLGANMDAVKEASRLGIAPERTASFINDSEGIEINFRCVSKAMKYFRACEELDESGWKSEIEHDQCRRG